MKNVFWMITCSFLFACGNKTNINNDSNSKDTTQAQTNHSNYNTDSLKGEYIGGFGNSTIIVSVNYINGTTASGYNVVKGNRRNIKGEVKNLGATYEFNLSEPGGDQYDGTFQFTIDTTTRTLQGTWAPFDTTKARPQKYKLTKRVFNHEVVDGFVGKWYLSDLAVHLRADKTGIASGYWWDEEQASSVDVEIPFTWFDEKNSITIEWSKNPVFPKSKMQFKHQKNEDEEFLQSGDYIMYRY